MPAKILSGEELAKKIREKVKKEIAELKIAPALAIVMAGENEASKLYVKKKEDACRETGIKTENHFLSEKTSQKELLELIEKLNKDREINGILVQLPLPEHLNILHIMNNIAPEKDVDGFHPQNFGSIALGLKGFECCTPKGVMLLLKETGIELKGKNAVMVGASNIVGKPLGLMLLNEGCTITYCHKHTKNLIEHTRKADILISAVGKPNLITKEMVKEGAIVIDVGTNRLESGKIVGDIAFEEVKQIASFITPVPHGVGPMTVACLLENTLQAAKKQLKVV